MIGGGLAGFSTAMAARERGLNVTLLFESTGATSVSSGAWDFIRTPIDNSSLETKMESPEWKKKYGKLLINDRRFQEGKILSLVEKTLETLKPYLSIELRRESPFYIPVSSGNFKATHIAQTLQTRASLERLKEKRVGFVFSKSWRLFADAIVKQWKTETNLEIDLLPIEWPLPGKDWPLPHVAARLSSDSHVREALISEVRKLSEKIDLLLFPPILLKPDWVTQIEQETGKIVAECLSSLEPTAGFRLRESMVSAMTAAGIAMVSVQDILIEKDSKTILTIKYMSPSGWKKSLVRYCILATGKFLGGGIDFGYHHLSERLLDLPLFDSKDFRRITRRAEISMEDPPFQESQPLFCLGIRVNEKWQPIDETGQAVFKNLFACGSIIGGIDYASEGVGLAYMAASGRACAESLS